MCFLAKQRRCTQTSGFLKNCFKGPSEWNYIAIAKQHCTCTIGCFAGLSAALPKEKCPTLWKATSREFSCYLEQYTGAQALGWAKAARPGCSSKGTLLQNSFLWPGAVWIFGANADTFASQVLCWRLKPFKIINSGSRPLTCVNSQVLRSKVHASLQWTTTGEYLNVLLSQTKTVHSDFGVPEKLFQRSLWMELHCHCQTALQLTCLPFHIPSFRKGANKNSELLANGFVFLEGQAPVWRLKLDALRRCLRLQVHGDLWGTGRANW